MHHDATKLIHPTRSAPLCINCAYKSRSHCNHPALPVDLVSGQGRWTCEDMRSDAMSRSLLGDSAAKCGARGALFVSQRDADGLAK